ncbi:hypothetical protein FNV43_RR25963 [Rhamnella rubrinervis]|uniref:Trichome birefringence-like N-terminal domain-containing protein n=1 Tax=Rhamnella rubrinervis TaxID=2594499 RepID=A0A8K0GNU6_9ROSA|nr:hypothetical protein FNV43_RR25963 [Rhamnella rubrinervis]
MNLKKLAFSEQFLLPRKVLSGFGFGIGVTIIVLALLMLSNSVRGPSGVPVLQGFQSVREGRVLDKTTHVENASQIAQVSVSEKAQLRNFTEQLKNGSFTLEVNRSVVAEKGVPLDLNDVVEVVEKPPLANFSEMVKNGSFHGEAERAVGNVSFSSGKADVGMNPGVEANKVRENSNVSDVLYNSQLKKMRSDSYEKCDIFDGKWVRDDSQPYYPRGSCPYIDRDFDCHLNGRPDDEYIKWKWQPNGCDIPRLNATDFLEKLRGKKLVFVGDSLNRNMWESLVCILRHSIRHKKRVYEISGKREFKKKGIYAFRFEDYNCSVDFVASPFLVRESSFTGRNGSFETLRLDLMDRTTTMYHDADIIVFNTGHWWTHEKTSKGEDYYQEGNYVHPRLKVLEAYKRALTTWARWVDKNIDQNRTLVLFRGYSVTHFRGGQWNSGGQCHKETQPIFNQTYLGKYPSKMRAFDHVLQEMKTPVVYLNISRLTDYRKDGHPSVYRMKYKTVEEQIAAEQSQDCSHWCLPGVPDTWNELLYVSLLKFRKGS